VKFNPGNRWEMMPSGGGDGRKCEKDIECTGEKIINDIVREGGPYL